MIWIFSLYFYFFGFCQGVLYLCEGFTTTLSYSIPKNQGSGQRVGRPEPRIEPPARSPAENITMTPGDWKCIKVIPVKYTMTKH